MRLDGTVTFTSGEGIGLNSRWIKNQLLKSFYLAVEVGVKKDLNHLHNTAEDRGVLLD